MTLPIDDKLLHAWLDDALTPEQRSEVDAWLRDHPDDAARVAAWAADGDALRAHPALQLDAAVPQRLAHIVRTRAAAARSPWLKLAAAFAIFLLGGAAGVLLVGRFPTAATSQAAAPWAERAVVAHAVYVPEQRHPVEVDVAGAAPGQSAAQEQHLQRWLTKRLDLPVKLFDLRTQGYELIGGRLLPDADGPSAQLMYQPIGAASASTPGATGRVTVYLRRPDSATPAAFRYEQHGDLGMFYWIEGQGSAANAATAYALVGTLPRDRLLALAEAIYEQGKPGH